MRAIRARSYQVRMNANGKTEPAITHWPAPRSARRARMRSLSNGLSINACANRFGEDLGRQHRQGRILHTRLRRIYTAEVIMRIPFHWFEIRVERCVLGLRP